MYFGVWQEYKLAKLAEQKADVKSAAEQYQIYTSLDFSRLRPALPPVLPKINKATNLSTVYTPSSRTSQPTLSECLAGLRASAGLRETAPSNQLTTSMHSLSIPSTTGQPSSNSSTGRYSGTAFLNPHTPSRQARARTRPVSPYLPSLSSPTDSSPLLRHTSSENAIISTTTLSTTAPIRQSESYLHLPDLHGTHVSPPQSHMQPKSPSSTPLPQSSFTQPSSSITSTTPITASSCTPDSLPSSSFLRSALCGTGMLKSELDLNALNAYLKDGPNTQQKIFRKLKVGIERVVIPAAATPTEVHSAHSTRIEKLKRMYMSATQDIDNENSHDNTLMDEGLASTNIISPDTATRKELEKKRPVFRDQRRRKRRDNICDNVSCSSGPSAYHGAPLYNGKLEHSQDYCRKTSPGPKTRVSPCVTKELVACGSRIRHYGSEEQTGLTSQKPHNTMMQQCSSYPNDAAGSTMIDMENHITSNSQTSNAPIGSEVTSSMNSPNPSRSFSATSSFVLPPRPPNLPYHVKRRLLAIQPDSTPANRVVVDVESLVSEVLAIEDQQGLDNRPPSDVKERTVKVNDTPLSNEEMQGKLAYNPFKEVSSVCPDSATGNEQRGVNLERVLDGINHHRVKDLTMVGEMGHKTIEGGVSSTSVEDLNMSWDAEARELLQWTQDMG